MPSLVDKPVGPTGYGLMGFTWRPNPVSEEQAFKAMKAALDGGANFWNGGEFYGTPERNSLQLLNHYFTKYPADADKVVISIKGGLTPQMTPDGSEEGVRRSVDQCLRVLDGKKFLDLFECARVDPNTPIETTIAALAKYVEAGKIGGISLSEVRAETIRRASKIHKISAVEVELSLFSPDILANGTAATCAELGIPVVAYSPLGRGFLTGEIKSPADIPEGDFRKHLPRFQPGAFEKNLELVREVEKLAAKKGCTPGQVAIAWVKSLSGKTGMPTIIPIPGSTTEKRVLENLKDVTLDESELKEIEDILGKTEVVGGRYGGPQAALTDG
ncbi:MAG: Pyridoxine 4-dehydrogenase [Thelocarpon impressellum]|nr:MAG: Pyridoxine 4-dehydrogenase [Thelocarpon impressellum]